MKTSPFVLRLHSVPEHSQGFLVFGGRFGRMGFTVFVNAPHDTKKCSTGK